MCSSDLFLVLWVKALLDAFAELAEESLEGRLMTVSDISLALSLVVFKFLLTSNYCYLFLVISNYCVGSRLNLLAFLLMGTLEAGKFRLRSQQGRKSYGIPRQNVGKPRHPIL